MIIVARLMIFGIIVAADVFFGVVFWYWQNDEKRRDFKRCK